ncbi:response regulator transcription factor [Nonomuraea sp. KM90]|uniref:response regulator transcription factor n=1 Tax=Nonomuraea sp. KM90 TaxID=3457428 RepID=UPI003FCE5411
MQSLGSVCSPAGTGPARLRRPGTTRADATEQGATRMYPPSGRVPATVLANIVIDESIAMRGAIASAAETPGIVLRTFTSFDSAFTSLTGDGSRFPGVVVLNPLGLTRHTERVRALCDRLHVLAFCPPVNASDLFRLIKLGVAGLVDWSSPPRMLIEALEVLSWGGSYMSQTPVVKPSHSPHGSSRVPHDAQSLTSRELDVLGLLAQGMTHKEIARSLSLSKTTVDTYVQRIRRKLKVGNKAQLTLAAYTMGLLKPGQDPDVTSHETPRQEPRPGCPAPI